MPPPFCITALLDLYISKILSFIDAGVILHINGWYKVLEGYQLRLEHQIYWYYTLNTSQYVPTYSW